MTCGTHDDATTMSVSYTTPPKVPSWGLPGSCGHNVGPCGYDSVGRLDIADYAHAVGPYNDGFDPRYRSDRYFNMLTNHTDWPLIGSGIREGNRNPDETPANTEHITNIQLLKGIGVSPATLPVCLKDVSTYNKDLCARSDSEDRFSKTLASLSIPHAQSPPFRKTDPCLRLSKPPVVTGDVVDAGCNRTLYGCGDAYYRAGRKTLIMCSSGPVYDNTTVGTNSALYKYKDGPRYMCTYPASTISHTQVIVYDHTTRPNPGMFAAPEHYGRWDYVLDDDGHPVPSSSGTPEADAAQYYCYTACKTKKTPLQSPESRPNGWDGFTANAFTMHFLGACYCQNIEMYPCHSITDGDYTTFMIVDQAEYGYLDAVQPVEFDLLPVRQIVVPEDDTHTPTYDPETFTCDCADGKPVYTCEQYGQYTDRTVVRCAWSWDRRSNGGAEVGLYVGSKQGPLSIAYRNYMTNHDNVERFYARNRPTKVDYEAYYSQEPVYVEDDKVQHTGFVKERMPGLCLRYPYGHTHPATHGKTYWDYKQGVDDPKVFYTYCGYYTEFDVFETDDHEPVPRMTYCTRDPMSMDERKKWCGDHPRWKIVRSGSIISNMNPPCNAAKTICIYFRGHPEFATLTELIKQMDGNAGTVVVSPVSFRVARGFMYNTTCQNLLTGKQMACTTGTSDDLKDHKHPVFENEAEWEIVDAVRGDYTVDAVKALLTSMKTKADAFSDEFSDNCEGDEVAIPSNDGQTAENKDIKCGTSDDLNPHIPWGTVIQKGITITSVGNKCDETNHLRDSCIYMEAKHNEHDTRAFGVHTSEPVRIDADISALSTGPCHSMVYVNTLTADVELGLILTDLPSCTPLIVTEKVRSNGSIVVGSRPSYKADHTFALAVSHFGGEATIHCVSETQEPVRACSVMFLNAARDHDPVFTCIPAGACDYTNVSAYTQMFGLAEERAVFNNPPSHKRSLQVTILICAIICTVCIIILYFETVETNMLIKAREKKQD